MREEEQRPLPHRETRPIAREREREREREKERERGFVDGERRHESRRDSRPPRLHARHGVLLRETQKPKENAAQVRAEKVRRESEETRRVRGIENQMMMMMMMMMMMIRKRTPPEYI